MDDLFLPLGAGCLIALASALAVVLARKPVYAAIALLVHSLSLAALFGILAAGLVAVGQVIIYSGAIVVLFLFVVTLLPAGGAELRATGSRFAAAVVGAGALLVALAAGLASGAPRAAATSVSGVDAIGRVLFGPLLVAFELTAPLLLVAIVGAVAIWRRFEPQRPAPPRTSTPGRRRPAMHR